MFRRASSKQGGGERRWASVWVDTSARHSNPAAKAEVESRDGEGRGVDVTVAALAEAGVDFMSGEDISIGDTTELRDPDDTPIDIYSGDAAKGDDDAASCSGSQSSSSEEEMKGFRTWGHAWIEMKVNLEPVHR